MSQSGSSPTKKQKLDDGLGIFFWSFWLLHIEDYVWGISIWSRVNVAKKFRVFYVVGKGKSQNEIGAVGIREEKDNEAENAKVYLFYWRSKTLILYKDTEMWLHWKSCLVFGWCISMTFVWIVWIFIFVACTLRPLWLWWFSFWNWIRSLRLPHLS